MDDEVKYRDNLVQRGARFYYPAHVPDDLREHFGKREFVVSLKTSGALLAPAGFGPRVMLPHVNRFLVAHPDVKIDFQLNDSYIDLIEQGIDVAVRIGALADSSLLAHGVAAVVARSWPAEPTSRCCGQWPWS